MPLCIMKDAFLFDSFVQPAGYLDTGSWQTSKRWHEPWWEHHIFNQDSSESSLRIRAQLHRPLLASDSATWGTDGTYVMVLTEACKRNPCWEEDYTYTFYRFWLRFERGKRNVLCWTWQHEAYLMRILSSLIGFMRGLLVTEQGWFFANTIPNTHIEAEIVLGTRAGQSLPATLFR